MRARLLAVLSAMILTGCSGPTAPVYDVEISITDSVEARRSQNEVNVVIPVKLKNLDGRILYYEECGHALLRRDGTDWRLVPLPPCQRSTPYSIGLNEGESYQFTFRIRMTLPSNEWPAVGATGEYRVVLWLTSVPRNRAGIPPQPVAAPSRTSPTFSITEVVIVL